MGVGYSLEMEVGEKSGLIVKIYWNKCCNGVRLSVLGVVGEVVVNFVLEVKRLWFLGDVVVRG